MEYVGELGRCFDGELPLGILRFLRFSEIDYDFLVAETEFRWPKRFIRQQFRLHIHRSWVQIPKKARFFRWDVSFSGR
jgi:hypothetical protein